MSIKSMQVASEVILRAFPGRRAREIVVRTDGAACPWAYRAIENVPCEFSAALPADACRQGSVLKWSTIDLDQSISEEIGQ